MNYKPQLQTLLYDLKHKPYCMLEKKAFQLESLLEQYLAGEIELPEVSEETPKEEDITASRGIAIIEINGVIVKRLGVPQEILDFFGLVDLDNVDMQLKAAMEDEGITGVVLYVTSPGGFLSGVQTTANLVSKLSEKKETVVYSDVLNASAAYWISSQANTIIASADAEIGSVGVYTVLVDYSKALENEGIKATLIKAGKWKALGEPTQPLTDEQKAFIQEEINQTWNSFKEAVNKKRDIDEDDLQGQTFNGELLLKKGFIDGFGSDLGELFEVLTEKET